MEDDDSYVADAINQEASIDAENQATQYSMDDVDRVSPADPDAGQQATQDSMNDGDRVSPEDLLAESDIYNDPQNVNNMGRTAKWIRSEEHQENTSIDGNTYAFVSRADGPMLGSMCKKVIMALTWVLETSPHRRNILRTADLIPSFDSEDRLVSLVERRILSDTEMDLMEGARDDIGAMRVDAIPLTRVCDFRSDYALTGYVEHSVKLGEIVVSPVCARYTVDDIEHSSVYWLVLVKTRRCFDF
jgi:hypothetical protein